MNHHKLDLDNTEAEDLRTALSIRLLGMREELVRTDDRAYREDLKTTLERLEVVYQRLHDLITNARPPR